MRWLPHPWLSLLLAITWCALNRSFHPAHLTLALGFALILPWLLGAHLPQGLRVRSLGPLLKLAGRFLLDLWRANWQVARLVLSGREPSSHWVQVPLTLRDPTGVLLLSQLITLTPGTLSAALSADGRQLLVHALDTADPESLAAEIKHRYESLLLRACGASS